MVSLLAFRTTRQLPGNNNGKMAEYIRDFTGKEAVVDCSDSFNFTELDRRSVVRLDVGQGRLTGESLEDQEGERSDEDDLGSSNTLSPDDETRIQQRRERNRLAAARCRDRRRHLAAALVQESDNLEAQNNDLMKGIAELEKEKRALEETLRQHLPNCALQRKFTQNPPLLQLEDQSRFPQHQHDQQPHQQRMQYQHQLHRQQQSYCLQQPHCQLNGHEPYRPQNQHHQQMLSMAKGSVGGQKSAHQLSGQF
ncbi:activating transcription factor 3-like [Acanthaster planci]|uniref:Activating transcription factor 3-like n=1 Tax=Acanthaster planci TaxID=133434 RepID=A0A8B7ZUN3_ACAPL|nr:activating transcription factor 3-like [Acanthaster planci]XP_022107224.1 activating transcription factor 3-like [Acanthaster planci]